MINTTKKSYYYQRQHPVGRVVRIQATKVYAVDFIEYPCGKKEFFELKKLTMGKDFNELGEMKRITKKQYLSTLQQAKKELQQKLREFQYQH